jgi:phage terminase large subunit GpA-like protein
MDQPEINDWYPKEQEALRPPPKRCVSEWADERRILQPGTSRQPGPWSTATTPYLKEPMDAYNDQKIRHIVLCFGTQLGKTETLYNILGFVIDLEPYSTLIVYSREVDAKSVSKTRIQPMIEANPHLASKKPLSSDLFTTLEMHFPGMSLFLVGANSAAALAQKPVRNLIRDEVDKYPDRIGEEADPLSLSEERTKSFWDIRKIVDASSPSVETRGIWKLLQACDEVKKFQVPCPFCRHYQVLDFDNIRYENTGETPAERINRARNTATLICVNCEKEIGAAHKMAMLAGGKWVVDRSAPFQAERLGFHLSSLYSPWLTWGDIAAVYLEAKLKFEETGDTGDIQRVINGWFALPWIPKIEVFNEDKLLELRTERPPLVVPADALALTAGIDVQKQGFYFTVWAWSQKLTSHLIHYGFLTAWEEVFHLVFDQTFEVEKARQEDPDQRMGIFRAGIDTGGGEGEGNWSRTEEIYDKLRNWPRNKLWGIKGLSRPQPSSPRVRLAAQDKLGGLVLAMLDTGQLKETFFWRLSNEIHDPQPARFHADTGRDFVAQLLAEERRLNKMGQYEWVQVRKNNHYLDASVYAHACADYHWAGGVTIFQDKVGLVRKIAPTAQVGGDKPQWIRGGNGWLKR